MRRVLVFAAALALLGASRGHSSLPSHASLAPSLTLWAWERSEDLRFLSQRTQHPAPGTAPGTQHSAPGTGIRVAFLDRTIRFDDTRVSVHYRQQPLLVSPDTPLISVVRIETRGRAPGIAQADATAALVVNALHAPRTTTLQIDFDARRSDRPFYAALIKSVRANLREMAWRRHPDHPDQPDDPDHADHRDHLSLSITALASWCMDDPWIDTRDVDEIVPMLFQMGPDARHVLTRLEEDGRWPVAACNGAAGLATDERHVHLPLAHTVYVFNPRAWTPGDLRAFPRN